AGPGGVGKTRLSVEVARTAIAASPGGVWFVDLAPVTDPGAIAERMARAAGVDLEPGSDALAALAQFLEPIQALLVVDNCEHLIDATARTVDRLLNECEQTRFLATSREPLHIPGESVYRLAPLERDAAVELFCERAREGDAAFEPTPDERTRIAEICRRLDGIALAIELAAARLKTLSVAALSEHLQERFHVLSGGSRTALPRQQTMRALLDWSYDLLSDAERALFRCLSLFATSFTDELVCATSGLTPADAFECLESLADKSLLIAEVAADRTRYRLLDSMREYARNRLEECAEVASALRAFAVAYADRAELWETTLENSSDRAWRELIDPELENTSVAMEWAFGPEGEPIYGQRIIGAMYRAWSRYSAADCEHWIHAALDAVTESTPRLVVARLQIALANTAMLFSRRNDCARAAEHALALLADQDHHSLAEAKALEGWVLRDSGSRDESDALLREALALFREQGSLRACGWVLYLLANAEWVNGNLDGARPLFEEALAIYTQIGADQSIGTLAGNLAEAEFSAGNATAALDLVQRAHDALRELDLMQGVAWTLCNKAAYLVAQDCWDDARACAREGLDAARDRRMGVKVVWALQHLAAAAALCPGERGRKEQRRAAGLLGFADRRIGELGARRMYTEQQEYDRLATALREALGASEVVALAEEGAQWDEERAVAQALSL
ncbi:MAG TPA: tetratricopeptide repeat protein, partial [Candidatus Baltobacteraceae bacterium]|nr:tetratricopeptide repeat protein [Candidatus Baltobacteraceae bacterium]